MTIARTETTPTPSQQPVAAINPEALRFVEAAVTGAGAQGAPERRSAIMAAFDSIMGANTAVATHALGFGATAAAASALLASGVSPAVAGTAALTGVVASVLNPGKGSSRG